MDTVELSNPVIPSEVIPIPPHCKAKLLLVTALLLTDCRVRCFAEPVRVVHKQGSLHGHILLRSADGKVIALGDQIDEVRGVRVWSRLVFHFRDGSVDDETSTFTQSPVFRLLTDHHVQKGPSFPEPVDVAVDTRSGVVTTRTVKEGKAMTEVEHLSLPSDLSNGIMSALLESFPQRQSEMKLSYLVGSSKPRIAKMSVEPDGKDFYQIEGARRSCTRYKVSLRLTGVAGIIAPIIGQQPNDIEVWVEDGPVPAFIRLRGALYQKGPTWTMELASPSWDH